MAAYGAMIYHLTTSARWRSAVATGTYDESTRGRTLAEEGFIHCSTATQWPGVRRAFYAGVADLVLLHIDERRLHAELRWEQVPGDDTPFPHLYGALNVDAVRTVEELADAGSAQVETS